MELRLVAQLAVFYLRSFKMDDVNQMALDPLSTTVGKSLATAAIKPTLGFLRQQIARRGAPFADIGALAGSDREIEEAISVLRGEADSLPATLFAKLKGFISDRPDSFADKEARNFIEDPRTVELIKSGARRILRSDSIDEERLQARALHAELSGGDGIYGETLIEDAIAFSAMTLLAHLTPDGRQMLELITDVRDEMRNGFGEVINKLTAMQESHDFQSLDSAPYDQVVKAETWKLRQQRMLQDPELPNRAVAFGGRVESTLRAASPEVQREAFREVAIVLTRGERIADAEEWLKKAEALGADTVPEHARIAVMTEDYDGALRMLRDRDDATSKSLVLDAIGRRDGEDAFFAHFNEHLRATDLTGPALQNAASRMILARKPEEARKLLIQASEAQLSESPVIFYIRARLNIAEAVPPEIGKRIIDHEGMLPRRTDLHDDAEGRRHLNEARADLERLKPILANLESPGFSALVDVNLTALSLCSSDETVRTLAQNDFVERMKDPAQELMLAPLARMYGIEIDWAGLKARLSQAERLGGYTEDQLRAAFTITMDEGTPAEVAAFVHKYRAELEVFALTESVVAIEIEALAKDGRKADALALLAEERGNLTDSTATFLETTFAEIDGSDVIQARLEQFEASGSAHDLEILVNAMGSRGDQRVGEYLVKLWRIRRQLEDAQRACEVLLRAGKEREAESFLEELDEETRADTLLKVHLAWARYRQGALTEASAELDALAKMGVDDGNARRLSVLLAVETGRWSDLEIHVRRELAEKHNRTGFELIAAAEIAMQLGSATTMDLLVAATEAAPEEPRIALRAYTISTQAGVERTPVVGKWLKFALESKDEVGLTQTTDLNEVVEMMTNSRKESERIGGLINEASVPIFMGIGMLGGSQSELIIHQMAANQNQTDARRRSVVPLFAGNRLLRLDLRPKSISFDPLSILVLAQLGLLDTAIDAFQDVVLPAGTLHSFFEDRGKAAHSQPSRVVQAKRLKEAVASGLLKVADPIEVEGSVIVDDEFDALFALAEKQGGYLIDNGPLHPPGRMDTLIDPAPYAARLMSPVGLVVAMRNAGAISRTVANAAEPMVAASGEAFADEPQLVRGRGLFLTNIAVHYLSDADLLTPLKAFAGELIVSKETVALADREIEGGTAAEAIRAGIEPVRATLARAIEMGRVRIGPSRRAKDEIDPEDNRGSEAVRMSPVMSVLRDTAGIDAFVCDDRAMNKYPETNDQAGEKFVFLTTADLIGIMREIGVIDDDAVDAAREKLRRSGAAMMPVAPDELRRYVAGSDWRFGPNAELRAVRDSIHLPLARKIVQMPQERVWVRGVCLSIGFAIRGAWADIKDDDEAEAAANWLLELMPDPVALSEHDTSPDRDAWSYEVIRMATWPISSIFELSGSRVDRYRAWFASRVEAWVARRDPGAFDALGKFIFAAITSPLDPDDLDD